MKKLWLMPAVIGALLFSACKKKDCCSFPATPDFILAQKNSVQWEASPSGNILGDTISVSGKTRINGEDEELTFKIVFDGIGYYALKANQNYYQIFKAGTAVALYKPDPTHVGSVTVISYNQTDKILQGFFDLRFLKISDKPSENHPDKILLREGKFKVSLTH